MTFRKIRIKMNALKVSLFLIGLLTLGAFNAVAGEYYVSVNGNDDGDGSFGHPSFARCWNHS